MLLFEFCKESLVGGMWKTRNTKQNKSAITFTEVQGDKHLLILGESMVLFKALHFNGDLHPCFES